MFSKKQLVQTIIGLVIMCIVTASFATVLLIQSKHLIYSYAMRQIEKAETPPPFPVSVDPATKTITENPMVDSYFTDSLAAAESTRNSWWNQVAALFAGKEWYQNLASPVSRIFVVWPGERKEEVTKHIGDILGWSTQDRTQFMELIDSTAPAMTEGKYFPGQYTAHKGATPHDIFTIIDDSFRSEILDRYTPEVETQVPFKDAMIVASLLEREASDFENMREVSGVIWNRLFADMPLQLDATLQYVKGSNPYQPTWWPAIVPTDKYTSSPYNTYQNSGLPPTPISNPSTEAVLAALNPVTTDCLFYFHTRNGTYHCSETYREHVSKLRSIYGRGS